KRGAMLQFCLVLQCAVVFLNDAGGDGQSEAGAAFLRGEERIEQSLLHLGRNAAAVVGDFEDDDVGFLVGDHFASGARAQSDDAVARGGIGGVLNQVDQHLFDLR